MAVDAIKKNEEIERDRYNVNKVEAYKPQQAQQVQQNYTEKKAEQQVVAAAQNPQDTYKPAAQNTAVGKEELAVAQIMISKNKADMKPEDLAKELSAQGMNVRADGKELHFLDENGNIVKTLKDTDGDGNIGMKDKEFAAAIQQLAATHPELNQLIAMGERNKAAKDAEGVGGIAAGYQGILNTAENAFAKNGQDVEAMLGPVQAELDAKNYTDNTAKGLYDTKQLQPVAAQLGIQIPPGLPEPGQNPYDKAMNLFKMSLMPYVNYLMG